MLEPVEGPKTRALRMPRQTWQIDARTLVHEPGAWGKSWKLLEGAIRLDALIDGVPHFVRLVLPGQLVGAEMMLKGRFSFRAQSVVPSVLMPWPTLPEQDVSEELLVSFASEYCDQADQMLLCHGNAESRLTHLLRLLTRDTKPETGGGRLLVMPGLRDIADITDLTMETVSRCITRLRTSGALDDLGRRQFRLWVERLVRQPATQGE